VQHLHAASSMRVWRLDARSTTHRIPTVQYAASYILLVERAGLFRLISARAVYDKIRCTSLERARGFIGFPWAMVGDTVVQILSGYICSVSETGGIVPSQTAPPARGSC
jgi:hypothetical protein